MKMFEYEFYFITVSRKRLVKKLNELGSDGWDVSTIRQVSETNEFDSEGGILYKWEILMKRNKCNK